MIQVKFFRGWSTRAAAAVLMASMAAWPGVWAATKPLDLDGNSSNGDESRCDLNVLSTFPVRIENVITNKTIGDAFDFAWRSAGPGGFTSSLAPGTSGGVGTRWTWTTNQSVFAFTGNNCSNDICFAKTAGPDPLVGTCSLGCLDDGVTLTVAKGSTSAETILNWSGGTGPHTLYRAGGPGAVADPANELLRTDLRQYIDTTSGTGTTYYLVRASTCLTPKPCMSSSDCNPASDGTCVSRGPFAVPGRSLTSTDITVSSASLSSSLITFFSPPTEVFRVTSAAQPGGSLETVSNGSTSPVTVVSEEYPAGCCPEDPDAPHLLRCGEECVDYLNDPANCRACGNACGEQECCSNGNCVSLCPEGWVLCDGLCVDQGNDSSNCGACGNACGDETCCSQGVCAGFCDPGTTWCGDGECADLQNDAANCGACGNDCGEAACCLAGACVSTCEEGRTYCDGLCYDLLRDPENCGACGNACGDAAICVDGVCESCDGHAGARASCDNRCVNLNTDPYNCGECGRSCNLDCPSGFKGVCSKGESCRCVQGTPAPQPPSDVPPPTDPSCPNPDPSPGPVPGGCPNPGPTSPQAPVCPSPGPPAPDVVEAPVCLATASEVTIPPGGSTTICRPGGLLFREVPAVVTVCGDGIPGPDGSCGDGVSNVASGTFMRLVPDTETDVGQAFVTPFAVHVIADSSNDGLIGPGESAVLIIDVLNAGPTPITDAVATLASEPVDLTDDGVSNPLAMTIVQGTSSYGTIPGTQPAPNCQPVSLSPAANALAFEITVPESHPGDTAHPLELQFAGTVDGSPFQMSVPIALGIVDRCVYEAFAGDFDGLDGLRSPMARLVPTGDAVPFPASPLNAGSTAPLKMRLLCGGVELRGADVDPPEIVGLREQNLGALDLSAIHLDGDSGSGNLFFRWNESTQRWIFNMRTDDLGVGTFTLTIRIAGRKDYVTGFELQ